MGHAAPSFSRHLPSEGKIQQAISGAELLRFKFRSKGQIAQDSIKCCNLLQNN